MSDYSDDGASNTTIEPNRINNCNDFTGGDNVNSVDQFAYNDGAEDEVVDSIRGEHAVPKRNKGAAPTIKEELDRLRLRQRGIPRGTPEEKAMDSYLALNDQAKVLDRQAMVLEKQVTTLREQANRMRTACFVVFTQARTMSEQAIARNKLTFEGSFESEPVKAMHADNTELENEHTEIEASETEPEMEQPQFEPEIKQESEQSEDEDLEIDQISARSLTTNGIAAQHHSMKRPRSPSMESVFEPAKCRSSRLAAVYNASASSSRTLSASPPSERDSVLSANPKGRSIIAWLASLTPKQRQRKKQKLMGVVNELIDGMFS